MTLVQTDINVTTAQCIKEATYFGHTVYTNICNGQTSTVLWGGADWAVAFFLGALGLGFLVLLVGLALMALHDIFY